jgi:dCMP deaminase
MLNPLKRPDVILKSNVLFPDVCLKLANEIAQRSKDPSTKVGAVIWDPKDKRVISLGYNGFPDNVPDTEEVWNNRTDTSALMKYDLVIHAEMNAILNARCDLRGKQIFVTHMPCPTCAKHIAACGIAVAVWPADSAAKGQNERDVEVCNYIFRVSNISTRNNI